MIVVLSCPRMGTTFYCEKIAKEKNYECLYEYFPDSYLNAEGIRTTEGVKRQWKAKGKYLERNTNNVIKIFPFHLTDGPDKSLLDKLKKIFNVEFHLLIRQNLYESIESSYITDITNNPFKNYTKELFIPYDKDTIDHFIFRYLSMIMFLKNLKQELSKENNVKLDFSETFFNENKKQKRKVNLEKPLNIPKFKIDDNLNIILNDKILKREDINLYYNKYYSVSSKLENLKLKYFKESENYTYIDDFKNWKD